MCDDNRDCGGCVVNNYPVQQISKTTIADIGGCVVGQHKWGELTMATNPNYSELHTLRFWYQRCSECGVVIVVHEG